MIYDAKIEQLYYPYLFQILIRIVYKVFHQHVVFRFVIFCLMYTTFRQLIYSRARVCHQYGGVSGDDKLRVFLNQLVHSR